MPASGALLSIPGLAESAIADEAAPAGDTAAPTSSGASGTGKAPDWAKSLRDANMDGLGPDGKQGDALARVMKTVVMFGNAFGATKLIDLSYSS